VLKYDDASLTEEEELQVQAQVYLSNDQAIFSEGYLLFELSNI